MLNSDNSEDEPSPQDVPIRICPIFGGNHHFEAIAEDADRLACECGASMQDE